MPKRIRSETIIVIVLSITFGLLSGFLGYSLLSLGALPLIGQVDVGDFAWDNKIVIDQPRNVIVQQDVQLVQVENNLLPTLASIYQRKQSTNPLNQLYLPAEALGQGLVLTADGWVASVRDALPALTGNYEVVGYQLKKYPVSRFIEDRATGIVFGKAEASNLPVPALGNSDRLSAGQTVAVVSRARGLTLAGIVKIGYRFDSIQEVTLSSEELARELILDLPLGPADNGATVVNLKGEVVGLVGGGRVVPVNYFKNIINQVLTNGAITRPVLGINYLDLAQIDGLVDYGDKGALVSGQPVRTSPAAGKLRDGDIIKKIDDVEINHQRGLADLLADYRPNDTIELLVQRGGEPITVEITLK